MHLCRLTPLPRGPTKSARGRDLIIGEVVHIHARDGLIDPRTKRIADERYRAVGRLYASRYCTTRQRFELAGPLPEE
jgi:hypothetical protein